MIEISIMHDNTKKIIKKKITESIMNKINYMGYQYNFKFFILHKYFKYDFLVYNNSKNIRH